MRRWTHSRRGQPSSTSGGRILDKGVRSVNAGDRLRLVLVRAAPGKHRHQLGYPVPRVDAAAVMVVVGGLACRRAAVFGGFLPDRSGMWSVAVDVRVGRAAVTMAMNMRVAMNRCHVASKATRHRDRSDEQPKHERRDQWHCQSHSIECSKNHRLVLRRPYPTDSAPEMPGLIPTPLNPNPCEQMRFRSAAEADPDTQRPLPLASESTPAARGARRCARARSARPVPGPPYQHILPSGERHTCSKDRSNW